MAATRPLARDGMAKGTFRSLKVFNYRLWAVGSLDRMSLYGASLPTAEWPLSGCKRPFVQWKRSANDCHSVPQIERPWSTQSGHTDAQWAKPLA